MVFKLFAVRFKYSEKVGYKLFGFHQQVLQIQEDCFIYNAQMDSKLELIILVSTVCNSYILKHNLQPFQLLNWMC